MSHLRSKFVGTTQYLVYLLSGHTIRSYRRSALRGYRRLKAENNLSVVFSIKDKLEAECHKRQPIQLPSMLEPGGQMVSSRVITQLFLRHAGGTALNRSVFHAAGGGTFKVHLLPPKLLSILSEHRVPLNRKASYIAWFFYTLLIWLHGVLHLLRAIANINLKRRTDSHLSQRRAHFFGINKNNVVSEEALSQQDNITAWYLNWEQKPSNINAVYHDYETVSSYHRGGMDVLFYKDYAFEIRSLRALISFCAWAVAASVLSLYGTVIGRWWYAFALKEASETKRLIYNRADVCHDQFLFNHEYFAYRPMWTYTAEHWGAELFLYFYSINNSAILPKHLPYREFNYWHQMSWPNYVVWNTFQKKFVEDYAQLPHSTFVVDEVPFADSGAMIPDIPGKTLAVFDIQPKRPWLLSNVPQLFEYVNKENYRTFLQDVVDVAVTYQLTVVIKSKRDQGDTQIKFLKHLHDSLAALHQNVVFIDSGIAPSRLIAVTDLSISFPYSSTGLIAKNRGQPCCYYNPNLDCILPSRQHEIEVCQGKEALAEWVELNLKTEN